MKLPSRELIKELLSEPKAPCLSLYMPTHRSHPENLQDVIRFKNLVRQMEESLLQIYSPAETQQSLEHFNDLVNDHEFWNHTMNGLAIFSSPDIFKTIGLLESIDELVMVAESFHTKPIRQYLQTADRFNVLGLSLHEIWLYEGNRHSLEEVELPADIPKTITDALGEELTDEHLTVASYGPIAVTNFANSPEQAVIGAIDKLKNKFNSKIGRLRNQKR